MIVQTTDTSDPLWEALFVQRLRTYLPYMQRFWDEIECITFHDTGTYDFPIYAEGQPPMFYRCSRSKLQSVVRGVQVFPFIHVASLNDMPRVAGGIMARAKDIFGPNKNYELDGFNVLAAWNIPSFDTSSCILIFIPMKVLAMSNFHRGIWAFMTRDEFTILKAGVCPDTLRVRLARMEDKNW